MKIRHVNVEPVWGASGVQGFFKSTKHWHQKMLAIGSERFLFHTFVAKASTRGSVLKNSAGQKRRKDFLTSFMPVASTPEERKEEIRRMVRKLLLNIKDSHVEVGILLDAYPNTSQFLDVVAKEDPQGLLAILVKLAPTVGANEVVEIGKHERCDGFCLGNGLRNFTFLCEFIRECRRLGVQKHINACGILGPRSAWKALRAGANSISIDSCASLAPWGVLPAILVAHVVTWFRFHFRSWEKFRQALRYHPNNYQLPQLLWVR